MYLDPVQTKPGVGRGIVDGEGFAGPAISTARIVFYFTLPPPLQ
jgi:hypothetical protein